MQLADGCMLPACMDCFVMIENGKKLAEERVLYDPSKKTRGGDRMVTVEDPGDYLKGEFVKAEKITKLKIINAPKYEDGDYGRQLLCMVECNNDDKTQKKFRFNNTNIRYMLNKHGKDSNNWNEMEIKIHTVMQSTPGGMKDVVYIVDD